MLSDKLKKLREDKGLQPKDVANFLGITRQGYCRYEDGKSDLSTSTLSKLADFYGVSTDYLLGRDEQKLNEDVTAMTDNELDKALIQSYMAMNETDKQGIRNYILEIFKRINELDNSGDNSNKIQESPPQIVQTKAPPKTEEPETFKTQEVARHGQVESKIVTKEFLDFLEANQLEDDSEL